MKDYGRAIHAEIVKLKRSQSLGLMTLAPLMVVGIFFFAALRIADLDGRGWSWLVPNTIMAWTAVFLPLCVALMTAALADIEHRGQQWKHLFALPPSRAALYTAKVVVAFGLLALATLVLGLSTWLSGRVLGLVEPTNGFDTPFPLADWLTYSAVLLPSAGFLLAIQTWASLRYQSFVHSVGIGFAGTMIGVYLASLDRWPYFPWRLPIYLLEGFETGIYPAQWLWGGAAGCVLCTLVGGWEVTRRDVF
ncbi:MAG: ABC transporter permease [Acidobacteriota bacterium]